MILRLLTSLLLSLLIAVPAVAELTITGRVFGPDAKPMTRAEVTLEPILASYDRARLRLDGKVGADPVARTRPDAGGVFEITAPEVGMWKVVVSAPGHLRMELRLVPLVAAEHLPVLQLRRTKDLVVRLRAAGEPRPGRLGIYTRNIRGQHWRPSLRLATAGDDGIARLPRAEQEMLRLEVLAPGHPMVFTDVAAGEKRVDVELVGGVAGTVRFTDQRGQARAGTLAYQGSSMVPLGLADDEGRLAVVMAEEKAPRLQASTSDLWTGAFDVAWKAQAETASDDTDPSRTVPHKDLKLDPPTILAGSVLDATNREPIPGALVWAVRGQVAIADSRGHYELAHSGEPPRMLSAIADNYQRSFSQVLSDGVRLDGPAIALQPAVGLIGRVIDGDGQRLASVEMTVTPLPSAGRYMSRGGPWIGETTRRGTFEVHGLGSGVGYEMLFQKPGFAPKRLEVGPLEPFSVRSDLEVVMTPGSRGVGLVVDEDEVPVAGAAVVLEPAAAPGPVFFHGRSRSGDDDQQAHATDAEGRFEIPNLAEGRYDLAVRAHGFAPTRVPGLQIDEGTGEIDFGTVVLVPGVELEGLVTDTAGNALAGAEVVARATQGPLAFSGSVDPLGQQMTGSDGQFVVSDLAPGQTVALSVAKKGYGTTTLASLRLPLAEPLEIVLKPAGRLIGRVVDRETSAVAGATIHVAPDPSTAMVYENRSPSSTRTDDDGRFVLDSVEPGRVQAQVWAPRFQRAMIESLEIIAGEEREIEIVLEPAAIIDGRVIGADGDPVIGAGVSISLQEQREISFSSGSQTDAEGRFHVDSAPVGPVYVTVRNGSREMAKKAFELRAGPNRIDLVLDEGYTVSGTVFDADGLPLGGVGLSIHEAQHSAMNFATYGPSAILSAADGTFTIPDVTRGRYKIAASLEGYAGVNSDLIDVDGDMAGVVLEMPPAVTLKGKVLGLELDELGSLSLTIINRQGGTARQGKVDFAGQYSITGLSPGDWFMQVQVGSSSRMQAVQVEIPDGVTEVEQDIEFSSGFRLTGVVLDGGEPMIGLMVFASGGMSTSSQATTDSTGRFSLEHLPAGTYQVLVMSPRTSMRHVEQVEVDGDRDLRIELSTGQITGRLVDATDGSPIRTARVTAERLDAEGAEAMINQMSVHEVTSDAQGAFEVRQVRGGTWRLVASRDGYGPAEATVVVGGGGGADVELRLTPTEGVTFEVLTASGATPPSLTAAILDAAGNRLGGGAYQVVDGRVRLPSVPAGRWELVVQGGDSAVTRLTVESPGDQGRIVLPAGGHLNLRVPALEEELMASVDLTGPDGKPFVYPMGSMAAWSGWMVTAGRANLTNLMPGTWGVVVRHADGRTWSGSAAVVAGATVELVLP